MKINGINLYRSFTLAAIACIGGGMSNELAAQREPVKHYLIEGNMAPGIAAQTSLIADPHLMHVVQPVKLVLPPQLVMEIGGQGAYGQPLTEQALLGMMIGPVYRFRLTNIPDQPSRELYPSIELLGRLHPPHGLENQFPIQINIEMDDLEQALAGRMVTKVIYLEDPEIAFPQKHLPGRQPMFDVSSLEDPLRAAERLGKPMAILRIGSRIPTNQPNDAGFHFHAPIPVILPPIEVLDRQGN